MAEPRWLDGRYEIGAEVSRGASAIVYRARDHSLGRDVALKMLSADFGLGRDFERFAREIDTLEQLQHPHIVPILGAGTTGAGAYYVMPLAPDGTLADLLRRSGTLSFSTSRQLALELTSALTFAHDRGVIHRDVKPSNVLISGSHYWLADFGIVRLLQDTEASRFTPSGITLGSPEYMSPEQLTGLEPVDHRTDIYSLGLVLYECLAGVHAFPARSAEASARIRLAREATPLRAHRPDVPAAFSAAVSRALATSPADRWQSSRELGNALVHGS